jgi:protein SCO1/2
LKSRFLILAVIALLAGVIPVFAHAATSAPTLGRTKAVDALSSEGGLPVIGPAPDFTLVSQGLSSMSLRDYRGKVVAIAFIYTSCPDVCPMLTAKMVQVQDALGDKFGRSVAFISITVDPERDTPAVLKDYADGMGANLQGWTFLTGAPASIADVVRHYGVFVEKTAEGNIDHTLLTSLVDAKGMLRVQYTGYRFDLEEFRSDLLSLVGETR